MNDDMQLVRDYAASQSEPAFAMLVGRYVNLVYSTARRQVRDPHLAEEITQAVFIILARKAGTLGPGTILPSWLHRTAGYAAADALKAGWRRAQRETEAHMQTMLNQPENETWGQIAPLLDQAIAGLGEKDRHAIVLRFFQDKSLDEIGLALGASEDAAKKRISRALDKLQKFFTKRGIRSTTAMLAGAISVNSVQAAPAGLAQTISAVAVAKGAAAGTSTLTLVKGALKMMAWAKAKTVVAIGGAILLGAGTTTVIVESSNAQLPKKIKPDSIVAESSWQVPRASLEVLEKALPQTQILPSKFSRNGEWASSSSMGAMGIAQPIEKIVQVAYQAEPLLLPQLSLIKSSDLPDGKYDFIAKLSDKEQPQEYKPSDQLSEQLQQERLRMAVEQNAKALKTWTENLQGELKSKLGVVAHRELRNENVLLLKIRNPKAGGIKPESSFNYLMRPYNWEELDGDFDRKGEVWFFDRRISDLVSFIERRLPILVIDQTDLTNTYDFSIKWSEQNNHQPNNEGMQRAMLDQLGLKLVPTNLPIEMLVVEKVK